MVPKLTLWEGLTEDEINTGLSSSFESLMLHFICLYNVRNYKMYEMSWKSAITDARKRISKVPLTEIQMSNLINYGWRRAYHMAIRNIMDLEEECPVIAEDVRDLGLFPENKYEESVLINNSQVT